MNSRQEFLFQGGRTITEIEIDKLRECNFPKEIIELLWTIPLVGLSVTIDSAADMSKLGVEMRWMAPDEMISECLDGIPGNIVSRMGYYPVGICLEGTGDYYYLSLSTSELVRIYHDSKLENLLMVGIDYDIVAKSLGDCVDFMKLY